VTPEPRDPSSREYYEETGYFEGGGEHLTDPDSPFHRYRTRMVLELCGPLRGLRIVDLGCGWGTISFALASEAASVVGVDFAQAAVDICRARFRREPVGDLTFLRADARDTGLPGGEWDLVVCADLVEHLLPDDTLDVYREALRLLRPGGGLVIWTPNPGHLLERLRAWRILRPDPTHVDYKTLGRVVAELQEAGFEVERAVHRESHLPVLSTVERLLMSLVPILRRRVGVRARKPERG
jgi:2-polyprenyl-3-methyl-5-hydroxy-6-metoxy-1,4-benzoquinol methylase